MWFLSSSGCWTPNCHRYSGFWNAVIIYINVYQLGGGFNFLCSPRTLGFHDPFDLRIIFLKWVGVYQPPCSNRSGAVSFWGQSCEGLSMMIATWQRPPSMMIHLTGKPVWCFRGVSKFGKLFVKLEAPLFAGGNSHKLEWSGMDR